MAFWAFGDEGADFSPLLVDVLGYGEIDAPAKGVSFNRFGRWGGFSKENIR